MLFRSTRIGVPVERGSETINKVCASGLRAVALADYMIRLDEAGVVLAGGMESMTSAPFLALGARQGYRLGDAQLADANLHDGLRDPWSHRVMYDQANEISGGLGITRDELDAWALRSHQRAVEAQRSGRFAPELTPVVIRERKGERVVEQDQGPREDSTLEALGKLPALTEGGTHKIGRAHV